MVSAKPKPRTIDEYLAGVKPDQRTALEKLRRRIQTVAPKAEECISYGIPAFRLNERTLGWVRRMGKPLLVLPDEFDDVEKISARYKGFPNQQRHASLLSKQAAAGFIGEETRSGANGKYSRLIKTD
jgi:uncharacterized protein YdhG (YjbR/CyaY superfamily)